MVDRAIPENLRSLHVQEEALRQEATAIVESDERLALNLSVIERAMDLADLLRQVSTEDENTKVVQVLGMRTFNAFGASVKLALSGYFQNSALIMRDILETTFLLELFRSDRAAIERWRLADKKERMKEFSPIRVRKALDERDGFEGKKRAAHYELFSELAAHPTMKSFAMLRPRKDGNAVIGPFSEATALQAVLSEMGKLAVLVGEVIDAFIPKEWMKGSEARSAFARVNRRWRETFYPKTSAAKEPAPRSG